MDILKIALIQSDLIWEQPEQNRDVFTKKINTIDQDVNLIILPEMFTTGFTMNPKPLAEDMNGKTILWMQEMAKSKKAAIVGSIIVNEGNKYYNRLLFVYPDDGKLDYYDKRHTFTLAGESHVYTAGSKRMIAQYKGWKICPLICYDLRFPVWSRNTEDYDVLLYVANWPTPRISAWDSLLRARAIENMCYAVGVNRVGTDTNNHEYSGHSACFNLLGEKMSNFKPHQEDIQVVELSKSQLTSIREKLQFLEDRDNFNLII